MAQRWAGVMRRKQTNRSKSVGDVYIALSGSVALASSAYNVAVVLHVGREG
jgi:hypothetical protein